MNPNALAAQAAIQQILQSASPDFLDFLKRSGQLPVTADQDMMNPVPYQDPNVMQQQMMMPQPIPPQGMPMPPQPSPLAMGMPQADDPTTAILRMLGLA